MSTTLKVRKGLNIRLVGEAEKVKVNAEPSDVYAVKPTDFHGVTPKMLVKQGESVKAGTPIFKDKYQDKVLYASPVSGEIIEIVRGEKRKILAVLIKADGQEAYEDKGAADVANLDREGVKEKMLAGGVWPVVNQRPLDIPSNPDDTPKNIYISGFDSAPLAPDLDFSLRGEKENFQAGVDALKKLTDGKVYLGLRPGTVEDTFNASGVEKLTVQGPHPAGNVGVQIAQTSPINKGDVVWTVHPQDVIVIGKLFREGKYDVSRIVALTGSEASTPKYYKTTAGASIKSITGDVSESARVISGNALTGENVGADGFLGFFDAQVTLLPEGDEPKFFLGTGWLGLGFDKFSNSRLFPTFLTGGKKFKLDTNLNGEERAFVVTGELEKVFPFDIYPMQLIKAIMANDIDGMESLGIYEVAPEDFALCEYVCTSKIDIQSVVREGLDTIKRECF